MTRATRLFSALQERIRAHPTRHHIALLVLLTLVSWAAVVLPLWRDPSVLYRHWDGPMYILVAKSGYRLPPDNPLREGYDWPATRLAPFLLAYPLAIRAVAPLLGYAWGMVALSVLFSASATVLFYLLLKTLRLSASPLWLAMLSLFVPYRWLVYRSVGATEPMFLTFVFLSLLLFARRRYAPSFLAAAIACDTRIQGLLLIPTYLVLVLVPRDLPLKRRLLLVAGTLAIPALLGLNIVAHQQAFGDPLAYWTANERMLGRVPFQQMLGYFRVHQEDYAYFGGQFYLILYAAHAIGLARLWHVDRSKLVFTFCLYLFLFLTLITDEDLARFSIPIAPFTLLVGFREVWQDRRTRWVALLLFAGTCVYAWRVIPLNVMPASVAQMILDWAPGR